ncbi:MAG: hypothetical protein EP329_03865 [Deltaproteobacteria bacterium]|nr:MAG: hypothetical protein EP329_03865 [Deltaproteobacteria bacterium]
MSSNTLDTLISRWIDDPDFRESLQEDPDAAAAELGLTLGSDDHEALRRAGLVRRERHLPAWVVPTLTAVAVGIATSGCAATYDGSAGC